MKILLFLLLLPGSALAQDYLSFRAPSGNIFCAIYTGDYAEARCDMRELTPTYRKRPADCDLEWGDSFAVGTAGRGGLVCHGDTVISPDAFTLEYGEEVSLGGLSCTSERTGMTCLNQSGHGFSIARARQQVF